MEKANLRSGFTTGACASAAAKAAASFALTGICPEKASLTLPNGEKASFPVKRCTNGTYEGWFMVQKDAGDDPDVTHDAWILASVEELKTEKLEELKMCGNGYFLPQYPMLYLDGGEGIGMATRDGLSCPPGHYAINPVPRLMILSEVEEICRRAGYDGCLLVKIAIPAGVELAEKTFNPRLGICGGISVLGTTGIVKPMSEEALLETIRLDIRVRRAAGDTVILMAPGNYGEAFLKESMGVSMGQAVLCSNFVAEAAQAAAQEGITGVLFVSHIGKLIKVSAGMKNTHSRYGDGRMEELKKLILQISPGELSLAESVSVCNTTDEALGLLKKKGLDGNVMELAAAKAAGNMNAWCEGRLDIQAVTFSLAAGVLGKTAGADDMLGRWNMQTKDRGNRR